MSKTRFFAVTTGIFAVTGGFLKWYAAFKDMGLQDKKTPKKQTPDNGLWHVVRSTAEGVGEGALLGGLTAAMILEPDKISRLSFLLALGYSLAGQGSEAESKSDITTPRPM